MRSGQKWSVFNLSRMRLFRDPAEYGPFWASFHLEWKLGNVNTLTAGCIRYAVTTSKLQDLYVVNIVNSLTVIPVPFPCTIFTHSGPHRYGLIVTSILQGLHSQSAAIATLSSTTHSVWQSCQPTLMTGPQGMHWQWRQYCLVSLQRVLYTLTSQLVAYLQCSHHHLTVHLNISYTSLNTQLVSSARGILV